MREKKVIFFFFLTLRFIGQLSHLCLQLFDKVFCVIQTTIHKTQKKKIAKHTQKK